MPISPQNLGGTGGSGTPVPLTAGASIQANDLVVVVVYNYNSATSFTTVSSITDGSNSYARATFQQGTTTFGAGNPAYCDFEMWYAFNATAIGSPTINVNLSNAIAGKNCTGVAALRCSGIARVSALDVANAATAAGNYGNSSGNLAVTSGARSVNNGFVVGGFGLLGTMPAGSADNISAGEDPNFTTLFDGVTAAFALAKVDPIHDAYVIASGSSSVQYNPSWPATSFGQFCNPITLIAAFKPLTAGNAYGQILG